MITNSILGATNRCNKHATVPLLTFTINKKVVTVSEETIASLLQRSVDLMTKFISTSTMGLWEGYPSSNLNTLPTRARDYLSTIIPLYDISKGEANQKGRNKSRWKLRSQFSCFPNSCCYSCSCRCCCRKRA